MKYLMGMLMFFALAFSAGAEEGGVDYSTPDPQSAASSFEPKLEPCEFLAGQCMTEAQQQQQLQQILAQGGKILDLLNEQLGEVQNMSGGVGTNAPIGTIEGSLEVCLLFDLIKRHSPDGKNHYANVTCNILR